MIFNGVRVEYGVIDSTIEKDTIDIAESTNSPYSIPQQLLDEQVDERRKIAYLEKDYFLLDGTFVFPEADTAYDVGWESAALSNESGVINEYIEFTFGEYHGSYGIQIRFPDNAPAKNFTIDYYEDESLIGTRAVEGNTAAAYTNADVRLNWNKVRITFTGVKPQQRARVYFVSFGVNEVYTEDYLTSVSASKSTDFTGDYEDSGEFSFQFFNDGRFDAMQINGLPIGLQEGLKVAVYFRKQGETEYKLFGNYFSEETVIEENGRIVSVSGYDELYRMNDSEYKKGVIYENGRSLYDWAADVALDAGVEIVIDEAFKNIISYGYINTVPHREALRLIAEAGNGMLYIVGRDIMLKKHVPVDKGAIGADDIVEGSHELESSDRILGVNIYKYAYSASAQAAELAKIDELILTEIEQVIDITYSSYPVKADTVQVSVTGATVKEKQIYAESCVITVTGTVGASVSITVTGNAYNVSESSVTRGSVVKNIKTVQGNYLITDSIASDVADNQYARVVNKYRHTLEIVNDKDYDLGDRVEITTDSIALQSEVDPNTQFITKVSVEMNESDISVSLEAIDE